METVMTDSQKRIFDNSVAMVMQAVQKSNINRKLFLDLLVKSNAKLLENKAILNKVA